MAHDDYTMGGLSKLALHKVRLEELQPRLLDAPDREE